MLALALAALLHAAPAQQIPVQRGAAVAPDTVTVGQPFRVVLRVRAPVGAEVEFPAGPDSTGTVEATDPQQVAAGPDSATAVDRIATYRMVAWDIEWQPIPMDDAVVRLDGRERRVAFGPLRVFVRSVLPVDSAQRVPKPPRELFTFGRPWWHWLLAALAAAAIIWFLVWWWRRRRRRSPVSAVADPFAAAEEEFTRVERLRLVEAGERSRYVALMVEVLRTYLARTTPGATVSLTTSELLHALHDETVPTSRLALLLADVDLIKFAARPVTPDRARELGAESRSIVHAVRDARAARDARERAESDRSRESDEGARAA